MSEPAAINTASMTAPMICHSQGQPRVLDLGSGAGDVAILAAWLVGREGQVIGVERDLEAVAWARIALCRLG
jgi:precorrin-6B methylase 2